MTRPSDPGRTALAAAADLALVAAFVVVGRRSHTEPATVAGFLGTAWPFAVGLAAGWLVTRAWRAPLSVGVGTGVWLVTVAVGLLLRALTGGGAPLAFAVVATIVLGGFLVGWRALAAAVARRTAARVR